MIEAESEHRDAATDRNGKKFSDEEIVGISVGFLVAGNETTASTMSSMAYLLALNPRIQEKLQSEIDQFFEHDPVSFPHYLYLNILTT
jgi:cytochrome P450